MVSFKHLYDTYIKSNKYGKYSKLTNLEVIVNNLTEKSLLPRMEKLIEFIKTNFEIIKQEVLNSQKSTQIDVIIKDVLQESNI